MTGAFRVREDWPLFAVPIGFHLADILAILAGGFTEVLGLALLASLVHVSLLGIAYARGRILAASAA
jgi:hypothetical protein